MQKDFEPKTLRENAGWLPDEVCAEWGIDRSTLSRWENNPQRLKKYQKQLYYDLKPRSGASS